MSKPIHYTQKYIANKHQFITVGSNDPMLIPSIVSQPNTTVMTILPSGNVGIGTTVPRQLLDIQGGTSIFSGNIGIGTTLPQVKLDVNGSIKGTLTFMTSQSVNTLTTVSFSNIPTWVRRVTVVFDNVSLNGTDHCIVQLGTGGVATTSGYTSYFALTGNLISGGTVSVSSASLTSGFGMWGNGAPGTWWGTMTLTNYSGNSWVSTHTAGWYNALGNYSGHGGGSIPLGGSLNSVFIKGTTTNAFDSGNINVLYEG